ncbi:YgaP-like transmembrane domain [Pseudomonas sp. GD03944]|uniref:YgaP-like transmembrane domain n=1 Tax=Pseudomonas sp. GD03944 TaxID=2975409 RepID=UPI00244BE0F0|nr:YgaP-like transmembrane domain [Pseudomonas sp. GD03944]MDH1264713.1 DUF2892 domain-containing protein [Pseudomonas sp. GD03944]
MKKRTDFNVNGAERGASYGLGLALLGMGLHRGGLLGVAGAALGGLLLARGISGRCELKRAWQDAAPAPRADKARYAHMPLDSEVHSPDFAMQGALPDTTPMGHERSGP